MEQKASATTLRQVSAAEVATASSRTTAVTGRVPVVARGAVPAGGVAGGAVVIVAMAVEGSAIWR